MAVYSTEMIQNLLEGRLPLEDVLRLQREKDDGRFEAARLIEQSRVPWDDGILVPLQEHLYVVEKPDGQRIVKCFCGQEFGDYRVNWKEASLVYERDPQDGEIYPAARAADPDWQVLREFYCPGCVVLLDVEPIPVGYPFIFNFLPDLDGTEPDEGEAT